MVFSFTTRNEHGRTHLLDDSTPSTVKITFQVHSGPRRRTPSRCDSGPSVALVSAFLRFPRTTRGL